MDRDLNKISEFSYILTLLKTCLVLGSLIILISIAQNPYGFFGTPRIMNFNDAISSNIYGFDLKSRSATMRWMEKFIDTTTPRAALIGSSRVIKGFEICDQEDILKLGLNGIKTHEIGMLARNLIEKNNGIALYIELKPDESHLPIQHDHHILNMFFGFTTLIDSTKNFYGSLTSEKKPHKPWCSTPNQPDRASRGNFKKIDLNTYQLPGRDKKTYQKHISVDSLKYYTASIEYIYDICVATRHHAQITFFTPPIHPIFASAKQINEYVSRIREIWTKGQHASNNNCQIEIAEYQDWEQWLPADRESWVDSDYWIDENHFNPALGDLFLKTLPGFFTP